MYNIVSNPTLTNVTFSGNSAPIGGGMHNLGSNPTLTNVTFSGNTAGGGCRGADDGPAGFVLHELYPSSESSNSCNSAARNFVPAMTQL